MTALLQVIAVGALVLAGSVVAIVLAMLVIVGPVYLFARWRRRRARLDRTGAAVISIGRARRLRAARIALKRGLVNRRGGA